MMKLSDFDYNLPKELIAQYPLKERDSARLMVLSRENKGINYTVFRNITDYLRKGDLLVLNNTKVLPARLFGARQTGGKVEILLLNKKNGLIFNVLIKPNRVKLNEKIIFNNIGNYIAPHPSPLPFGERVKGEGNFLDDGRFYAVVSGKNEVTFSADNEEEIYKYGVMPLPPYIKRQAQDEDNIFYQTVYASCDGSIAAPTAGLHFTDGLISKIKSRGANIAYVTLHVGLGTFKPVKADDISRHRMEAEYFFLPDDTLRFMNDTRLSGGRVIAVGTTSLRVLETYALKGIKAGETDLFIYPGYKFKIADCLLTNFHLPCSTLFMLTCAFGGEELVKKAYQQAIKEKYRFYSYGDAMLIV